MLNTDRHRQAAVTWGFVLALALISLPYVFIASFNEVQIFDDQGTLMIGFRDLLNNYIPYRESFLLYGPFYYVTITPLFDLLQIPLNHDWVRMVSSFFWVASSVVLGALMFELSRSMRAGAFAFFVSLFLLKGMLHSPMHPQELSFLMIAVLFHLLLKIERDPKPVALMVAGAIVGGLLLTKINLAAFVALPLMLGLLRGSPGHFTLRIVHALVLCAGVAMPIVLMKPLLHFPWAYDYCLLALATISAALLVWCTNPVSRIFVFRHWVYCFSGFTVVVVATVVAMMTKGVTATELLDAVIFEPQGRIHTWYGLPEIQNWALIGSAISLVLASSYAIGRAIHGTQEIANISVSYVKIVIGFLGVSLIFFKLFIGDEGSLVIGSIFQGLVPFSWLFIVPVGEKRQQLARQMLGLFAAFMILYAFPVPWGQSVLAAVWAIILLPLLFQDFCALQRPRREVRWLNLGYPSIPPWAWRRIVTGVVGGSLAAILVVQTASNFTVRRDLEPLGLPGSSLLRTDPLQASDYRWAVGKLAKCQAFYMFPGLSSFYFWTNQNAPTGLNTNNPLGLLSEAQQAMVVSDLDKYKELCVLYIPALLLAFDRGQIANNPPLLHYIKENFVEVESQGIFHLLHRSNTMVYAPEIGQ
jgi:hypothetical protein